MHARAPQHHHRTSAMSPVRVIETGYVFVPATTTPPPKPMKLTSMEAAWLAFPVLQHVLLFIEAPPFEAVLDSLQSSLATALASFAPLAGQLVHLDDTGDVAITCSASDGVRFVVAESDADARRLAREEVHDLPVLQRLVPDADMSGLPTAVLAVQATRFEGGGVAVGLTVHHAVADGRSLWTFVEAWAAACRGATPSTTAPTFDRSLVHLPGCDEELARSIFRETLARSGTPQPSPLVGHHRWTFALDTQDIQRLKQRILRLSSQTHDDAPLARPPSTFAAVTALAWTCFARCKPFAADDDDALLFFLADVRGRLDPPVDTAYIGVCLTQCLAAVPVRELRGARALLAAASAIQEEVRRMNGDPTNRRSHLGPVIAASWDRLMTVSGSSSFTAYEVADFGWGKPRRTEPVWMNHDGQVALMGGRDGDGVQVSVSLLQQAQMDGFKSQFLDLLGSS